jgi:ribonuclease D
MTEIHLYKNDLPDNVTFSGSVAVDTETMGLKPYRDRLCVVQLSGGDGVAHLVQFEKGKYDAPNLKKLFTDPNVEKIFHFARFDLQVLKYYLKIEVAPVYCTKMASKLCRTFTERHGLRELCSELLDIELNKQKQSSDWGASEISKEQMEYAASDVLHLHELKAKLDVMIEREGRVDILKSINNFLNTRADLDRLGWRESDIFSHSG